MKKKLLSFSLAVALMRCETETKPDTLPITTKLTVILDRSKSYVKFYEYPSASLFKPYTDSITKYGALDFRYGIIAGSDANTVFLRYYKPFKTQKKEHNAWLASEQKPTNDDGKQWTPFAQSVSDKLAACPSMTSDISHALIRGIAGLQEDSENKNVRRILLLATDYKHNATNTPLPSIPENIEVYSIGILSREQVAKILHTQNVQCFETIAAALDHILQSSLSSSQKIR